MAFSQRHEKGIGAEAENFSLELNFPRDQRCVALRLLLDPAGEGGPP